MKYLKDLSKVSFFVLVMYIPIFFWIMQDAAEVVNHTRNKDYAYRTLKIKNNMESLITSKRYAELCIRLATEYDNRYIESYRFTSPEIECYQPKSFKEFPPIEANAGPVVLKFEGHDQTFLRFKFEQTDWAYSVLTLPNFDYFQWLKEDANVRKEFYQLLLLSVYIIFTFVFFSVLVAVDSIKNKFKKSGQDPLWLKFFNKTFGLLQLGDMQVLKLASTRLIELKNTLELERDVLQRSLEHTILTEIRTNNHKVPYTFYGTVAKVDINGFSKIVAQGASQTSFEMSTLLENIGCELLQRYGGLFEKTVGDEIVVVFRGDDSALKATAFVRDLMHSFSELSFSVGDEVRKFTLKGSIASSKITFCKRSAGYGFLGDAFTITSRLLEGVVDKEKNVLSVLESRGAEIKTLVTVPTEKVLFKFKNMQPVHGFFITEFHDISAVVSKELHSKYFLSDFYLTRQIESIPRTELLLDREILMNNFSNIEIRLAENILLNSIFKTIRELTQKPSTADWNRTLARMVSSLSNLIPTSQWNERYSNFLLSIPLDREGRVNSAILGVLMIKDPQKLSVISTDRFILPRDTSHRTQGQILIALSRHSLTDRLLNQIINMILSKNENESATGIFVACEVINYYWKADAAGFTVLDQSDELIKLMIKKNSERKLYISKRLHEYLKQTIALVTAGVDESQGHVA